MLRLYGRDVLVARTGPTALAMASASRPDVVLLDIGLPGMDGYQVARHLRKKAEFKTVTLCALTGFTPERSTTSASEGNGVRHHYYVKPVELQTLLEMSKGVERQQTLQEERPDGNRP